jgi:hypothetical protein
VDWNILKHEVCDVPGFVFLKDQMFVTILPDKYERIFRFHPFVPTRFERVVAGKLY